MDQATQDQSNALSILGGLVESANIFMDIAGQFLVLKQVLGSRDDAKLYGILCIARPLANYLFVYREADGMYNSLLSD